MGRFGKTVAVVVGALCLLYGAQTAAAATKVKRIWPREFIDWDASQNSYRSPAYIGNNASAPVEFHAPLVLPTGARITKVTLWSAGVDPSNCSAWVARYGPATNINIVANGSVLHDTGLTDPTAKDLTLQGAPEGIGTIQNGFRYDVAVTGSGPGAYIWAVDITYVAP